MFPFSGPIRDTPPYHAISFQDSIARDFLPWFHVVSRKYRWDAPFLRDIAPQVCRGIGLVVARNTRLLSAPSYISSSISAGCGWDQHRWLGSHTQAPAQQAVRHSHDPSEHVPSRDGHVKYMCVGAKAHATWWCSSCWSCRSRCLRHKHFLACQWAPHH